MSDSPLPELAVLLRILKAAEVPHALIGGWAVITWGFLRTSDDLDLLIRTPPRKPAALLAALAEDFQAEWIEGGLDDPVPGLIRAVPFKGGLPVDLLVARGSADRAALGRAKRVTVEGLEIPIVGPEDLIAMKLEAGGGQDYEDARRLLAILSDSLDQSLLRASCRERKVEDRLELLTRVK